MKSFISITIFFTLFIFSCSQTPSENVFDEQEEKVSTEAKPSIELPAIDNERIKKSSGQTSKTDDKIKFVQTTPPDYIEPIVTGEDSIYGYYIPTTNFADKKLPFALILNKYDEQKIAWVLYSVSQDDTHNKIGVGFITVDKDVGGIFIEQRDISGSDDQDPKLLGLELFPAEFRKNELFIKKAVKSEGTTIFSELLGKYEKLHFVRLADLEVKPTAVVFGNFHPANERGLPDKRVLLRIWTNGSWTLSAFPEYFGKFTKISKNILDSNLDEVGEKIIISGTWTATKTTIRLTRNHKLFADEEKIDFEKNPPTEDYDFVFDTQNFVLWLTMKNNSEFLPVGITQNTSINSVSVFLPASN